MYGFEFLIHKRVCTEIIVVGTEIYILIYCWWVYTSVVGQCILYKHIFIPLVKTPKPFFFFYLFIFNLFDCTMKPSNHPGYLNAMIAPNNHVISLQPSRIQPLLKLYVYPIENRNKTLMILKESMIQFR